MAYTDIDDPSEHFQTALWSGNGPSTQSITFGGNSNLKPDWTWSYGRGVAFGSRVQDSSRGIGTSGKLLSPNLTNAESDINDYMMTYDTDGFSVGSGDAGFNASNDTYATWAWKANGGTTSSNTNGSITSTVQANQDAGFSIVTYTGTGSAGTVGHGLGVAPDTIITKNRDTTADWYVKHHKHTNNYGFITLNNEAYFINNDSVWTQTDPTSTVYSIGSASAVSQNNTKVVAYCFAEKQGYSKFGIFYGNQNANGPFAYTGFKPAFILVKSNSNYKYWYIYDNQRDGYNPTIRGLPPSVAGTEAASGIDVDFLSNGFKMRAASTTVNYPNTIHYYWAFAENPFVSSSGIPTTAR
tara:strand:- start:41 stop:1102 length:1062 start_codon:yes stop_codon:yes gene_type:complete